MFSDWIKSLEKSGVKLYEIADVIDVTYQTIQCYRDRNNYPTVKNLIKLSEHYNISIEDMLHYNEDRSTACSEYSSMALFEDSALVCGKDQIKSSDKKYEEQLISIYRKVPDSQKAKLLDDFSRLVSEETKKLPNNN
ncbi:MAG: helix-turn-helix transcriptional regulator [Oscillospiraceae bacterium]|nr:helix-turn-helix transcriptional regulator [Oscillospiraceae bacterium]